MHHGQHSKRVEGCDWRHQTVLQTIFATRSVEFLIWSSHILAVHASDPILDACWGAFAGSLRSVSLDIPMKGVAPKFSRTSGAWILVAVILCPFGGPITLNYNSRSTITVTRSLQTIELSLQTAGSSMHPSIFRGGQFDFGPFFKSLYYVPHLNTLALDIAPSTRIASASRLLKAHANTLHTFLSAQ
jgi:hypothetical protein